MAEQKVRLEREKQKRMEEQERQQKERQKREELERRRAKARAGKRPKNVESALQEMLDERETTDVEMSVDPEGLKVAQTAYRLYMRKKAR
jgi:membrane protein involved in colicin uptake